MIFKFKKHDTDFYNTLLGLSRNIFFYKDLELKDTFETRIYLMFIHFAIMMKISKKKGVKFDQKTYDLVFQNIEYNLRELGFGDVSVNKKMKDLNKILYDILLKFEEDESQRFSLRKKLVFKYFSELNDKKKDKFTKFEGYFNKFNNFCFELPLNSMIREAINFKY